MLTDEEIEDRVRSCLLDASSDDCWISATSTYAVDKVVALVKQAIKDSRDPDEGMPWTVDGLID